MTTLETTYDVAIEFEAVESTVSKLIQSIGEGNVEVARLSTKYFKVRVQSNCLENELLKSHIKLIAEMFRGSDIGSDNVAQNQRLNIGVFYYTATCSVEIDYSLLSILTEYFPRIVLSITCYPCNEEVT